MTALPADDRLRWLSFDHAALRSRFRCPSSAGRHLTCDFRRRLLDLEEVGTDVGGQNLAGEFDRDRWSIPVQVREQSGLDAGEVVELRIPPDLDGGREGTDETVGEQDSEEDRKSTRLNSSH